MSVLLRSRFLFVIILLVASWAPTQAEDWLRFRGPQGSGISKQKDLPTKWDGQTNIRWKTKMPGGGASSPVTFGKRIYVTCYTGYGASGGDMEDLKRHLLAIDRDSGKIIWDKAMPSKAKVTRYSSFPRLHGYASSTPAVDKSGIYVFYGSTGAAKYDHDGKLIWNTSCGTRTHGFGTANSPILYNDFVILNASVESGSLVALDKTTGTEKWRTEGIQSSWNTPIIVQAEQGPELVLNTRSEVQAYSPDTGKLLWKCKAFRDYICPSVVFHDGVIYAIGARAHLALAVKVGGRGDVTESRVVWNLDRGSNVSSPVYHEGHLYWTHEGRRELYCVNAKTGKIVNQKTLKRPKRSTDSRFYGSPLYADGKLYITSRGMGTYLVAANPKMDNVAHNVIENDTSTFNGSPVPSNGQLLLRSDAYLYCIGKAE
ncbi:MAG: PQQ-binding-like beta-propeller repeat protein [Gemmataceae bacterium]